MSESERLTAAVIIHTVVCQTDHDFGATDNPCERAAEQIAARAVSHPPVQPDRPEPPEWIDLAADIRSVDRRLSPSHCHLLDYRLVLRDHTAHAATPDNAGRSTIDVEGGIVQRSHVACSHCWCGEHHEEGR